jgi:DNA polymerase III subunit gamma/tau
MAWYNKYRPQQFSQVIGQDLVKQILQKSIEKGKIKHAYLFSGPKGTGKTTLARIFASSVNNTESNSQASLDIIEMDAASNTGIDDIRSLIESAKIAPISGKYKIYIIDEVHMLSKNAMNALLKILEEPPSYLIFLFCTTNPEKLIPTILSRLTKLTLSSHSIENITKHLNYIAKLENVNIDEPSLELIARHSSGGQRDAINLLESLASYHLEYYDSNTTASLLGLLPQDFMYEAAKALLSNQLNKELYKKSDIFAIDGNTFLGQFLDYLLDRSLDSDNQFDPLIIPVAEIISLRLPINSIQAGIILVSSKINYFYKEQLQVQVNTTAINTVEVNKQKPLEEISQEVVKLPISPKETTKIINTAPNTVPNATSNSNLELPNLSQLNHCLEKIRLDSKTPPTLKLVLTDAVVTNLDNLHLTINVSNGIFLAQLSSEKNQAFLIQKFQEIFNQKFTIGVKQERVKREDYIKESIENTESVESVENIKNSQNKESKILEQDYREVDNKSGDEDDFYSFYKRLPGNMEATSDNLKKVIQGPLQKPIKTIEKDTQSSTESVDMSNIEGSNKQDQKKVKTQQTESNQDDSSQWDELIADFELE